MNRFYAALLIVAATVLALPARARSETLAVNTTADTPGTVCGATCSLRQAITVANANPDATTITLPPGDYNLSAGMGDADFTVNAPLNLVGAGTATTTIRDANRRLFVLNVGAMSMSNLTLGPAMTVESGALIDDITFLALTLDHVHLTGGTATSGSSGGALNKSSGTLTVTDSEFDGNTSASGGALHLSSVASTFNRVTFADNSSTSQSSGGGAIYQSGGSLGLTNATFFHNSAVGDGGSVNVISSSSTTTTIVNSTFTNSNATFTGDELARITASGDLTIRNSIFGPSQGPDNVCDINTLFLNDDGNIDSGNTCNFNRHNINPGLGVFAHNGGAVQTVPIDATSPAFDTGRAGFCPATDARNFTRPAFAGCDVGAFEVQGAPAPTPPVAVTTAATGVAQTTATLDGTVNPSGSAVTDCHFEYGKTTGYGTSIPCATSPGNGSAAVAVSAAATGLTAATTYHVKLFATTANGSVDGGDVSFATSAATATAPPTPKPTATPSPTPVYSVPTPSPTPGPTTSPALACSKAPVVLIDVLTKGGHVLLTGAARDFLVGKKVSITFAASKKVVATTTVKADGTFTASAPLPPRKVRFTNRARYQAKVLTNTSASLKLNRRMYLTKVTQSGTKVAIAGRVTGRFKAGAKVRVTRRVTCGSYKQVGTTRLSRKGTFSIKVPAPTGAAALLAVYRGTTSVLKGHKTFPTFTLSQPAG